MDDLQITELAVKIAIELQVQDEPKSIDAIDKIIADYIERFPLDAVVKVNFADTLIEKFDAEVAVEKTYIDELEEQQYSRGIWEGIRLSRIMLKEIIKESKISA